MQKLMMSLAFIFSKPSFSSDSLCQSSDLAGNLKSMARCSARMRDMRKRRQWVRLAKSNNSSCSTGFLISYVASLLISIFNYCLLAIFGSRMASAIFKWKSFFLILAVAMILVQTDAVRLFKFTFLMNQGCVMRSMIVEMETVFLFSKNSRVPTEASYRSRRPSLLRQSRMGMKIFLVQFFSKTNRTMSVPQLIATPSSFSCSYLTLTESPFESFSRLMIMCLSVLLEQNSIIACTTQAKLTPKTESNKEHTVYSPNLQNYIYQFLCPSWSGKDIFNQIWLLILMSSDILQLSFFAMRLRQLHVKIGLCSINNDPLDFKNNSRKIHESIEECKRLNCSIRVGGQLEISGYGCEDHFLQYDTVFHSWDVIKDLLVSGVTKGIVAEVGCPILHKAALYNGRVILYNSKVVAIRVKMILADGGNYFETRYFSAWKYPRQVGDFMLPQIIQDVTGQRTVPIGCFIIDFNDTSLAYEICEESWISNNPMIDAALDGAEIFINVSGSEIERGKLKRKLQMLEEFTQRHGGAYAYVNIKGAVGGRNYFDGCCFFSQNGKVRELSEPFQLGDVQVTPVTINLNSVRTFRISNKSFQKESHGVSLIPRVHIDLSIANNSEEYIYDSAQHRTQLQRRREMYEFPHATFEPSAYLWDVLRKSKARGFFLPLSGGLDSCTVALIVYNMCYLLYQQINSRASHSQQILNDLRNVLRERDYIPQSPQEMCNRILFTAYLATENSSESTRKRAKKIAQTLGCRHRAVNFDQIYRSYQKMSKEELGLEAKYKKEGGSWRTDLALQNIQSRSRMVLTYFLASLQVEKDNLEGFLLVLGSSNLDESLRGYFTKYDCSSADINPIGSFSKFRLKELLEYFQRMHQFDVIKDVFEATPTAELRPLHAGQVAQTDEEDMGLTYAELCVFGKLRKNERLGPVSMFDRMYFKEVYESVQELALKIKRFFTFYAINRHKCTTLPPSFHFDPESCDDNRYDMRPYIYATDWSYQFEIIDERVKEILSKNEHLDLANRSASLDEYEKKLGKQHQEAVDLPSPAETSKELKDIFEP